MMAVNKIQELLGLMQKNLECSICLELMKNPVATKCEHFFCKFCITEFLETKRSVPCPLCKQPITKRSLTEKVELGCIVDGVTNLISAFQDDSGTLYSPPSGPQSFFPCTPETINSKPDNQKTKTRKNVRNSGQQSKNAVELEAASPSPVSLESDNIFAVPRVDSLGRPSRTKGSPAAAPHTRTASAAASGADRPRWAGAGAGTLLGRDTAGASSPKTTSSSTITPGGEKPGSDAPRKTAGARRGRTRSSSSPCTPTGLDLENLAGDVPQTTGGSGAGRGKARSDSPATALSVPEKLGPQPAGNRARPSSNCTTAMDLENLAGEVPQTTGGSGARRGKARPDSPAATCGLENLKDDGPWMARGRTRLSSPAATSRLENLRDVPLTAGARCGRTRSSSPATITSDLETLAPPQTTSRLENLRDVPQTAGARRGRTRSSSPVTITSDLETLATPPQTAGGRIRPRSPAVASGREKPRVDGPRTAGARPGRPNSPATALSGPQKFGLQTARNKPRSPATAAVSLEKFGEDGPQTAGARRGGYGLIVAGDGGGARRGRTRSSSPATVVSGDADSTVGGLLQYLAEGSCGWRGEDEEQDSIPTPSSPSPLQSPSSPVRLKSGPKKPTISSPTRAKSNTRDTVRVKPQRTVRSHHHMGNETAARDQGEEEPSTVVVLDENEDKAACPKSKTTEAKAPDVPQLNKANLQNSVLLNKENLIEGVSTQSLKRGNKAEHPKPGLANVSQNSGGAIDSSSQQDSLLLSPLNTRTYSRRSGARAPAERSVQNWAATLPADRPREQTAPKKAQQEDDENTSNRMTFDFDDAMNSSVEENLNSIADNHQSEVEDGGMQNDETSPQREGNQTGIVDVPEEEPLEELMLTPPVRKRPIFKRRETGAINSSSSSEALLHSSPSPFPSSADPYLFVAGNTPVAKAKRKGRPQSKDNKKGKKIPALQLPGSKNEGKKSVRFSDIAYAEAQLSRTGVVHSDGRCQGGKSASDTGPGQTQPPLTGPGTSEQDEQLTNGLHMEADSLFDFRSESTPDCPVPSVSKTSARPKQRSVNKKDAPLKIDGKDVAAKADTRQPRKSKRKVKTKEDSPEAEKAREEKMTELASWVGQAEDHDLLFSTQDAHASIDNANPGSKESENGDLQESASDSEYDAVITLMAEDENSEDGFCLVGPVAESRPVTASSSQQNRAFDSISCKSSSPPAQSIKETGAVPDIRLCPGLEKGELPRQEKDADLKTSERKKPTSISGKTYDTSNMHSPLAGLAQSASSAVTVIAETQPSPLRSPASGFVLPTPLGKSTLLQKITSSISETQLSPLGFPSSDFVLPTPIAKPTLQKITSSKRPPATVIADTQPPSLGPPASGFVHSTPLAKPNLQKKIARSKLLPASETIISETQPTPLGSPASGFVHPTPIAKPTLQTITSSKVLPATVISETQLSVSPVGSPASGFVHPTPITKPTLQTITSSKVLPATVISETQLSVSPVGSPASGFVHPTPITKPTLQTMISSKVLPATVVAETQLSVSPLRSPASGFVHPTPIAKPSLQTMIASSKLLPASETIVSETQLSALRSPAAGFVHPTPIAKPTLHKITSSKVLPATLISETQLSVSPLGAPASGFVHPTPITKPSLQKMMSSKLAPSRQTRSSRRSSGAEVSGTGKELPGLAEADVDQPTNKSQKETREETTASPMQLQPAVDESPRSFSGQPGLRNRRGGAAVSSPLMTTVPSSFVEETQSSVTMTPPSGQHVNSLWTDRMTNVDSNTMTCIPATAEQAIHTSKHPSPEFSYSADAFPLRGKSPTSFKSSNSSRTQKGGDQGGIPKAKKVAADGDSKALTCIPDTTEFSVQPGKSPASVTFRDTLNVPGASLRSPLARKSTRSKPKRKGTSDKSKQHRLDADTAGNGEQPELKTVKSSGYQQQQDREEGQTTVSAHFQATQLKESAAATNPQQLGAKSRSRRLRGKTSQEDQATKVGRVSTLQPAEMAAVNQTADVEVVSSYSTFRHSIASGATVNVPTEVRPMSVKVAETATYEDEDTLEPSPLFGGNLDPEADCYSSSTDDLEILPMENEFEEPDLTLQLEEVQQRLSGGRSTQGSLFNSSVHSSGQSSASKSRRARHSPATAKGRLLRKTGTADKRASQETVVEISAAVDGLGREEAREEEVTEQNKIAESLDQTSPAESSSKKAGLKERECTKSLNGMPEERTVMTPQLDSAVTRVPDSDSAITQAPESDSAITKAPEMDSAITQAPERVEVEASSLTQPPFGTYPSPQSSPGLQAAEEGTSSSTTQLPSAVSSTLLSSAGDAREEGNTGVPQTPSSNTSSPVLISQCVFVPPRDAVSSSDTSLFRNTPPKPGKRNIFKQKIAAVERDSVSRGSQKDSVSHMFSNDVPPRESLDDAVSSSDTSLYRNTPPKPGKRNIFKQKIAAVEKDSCSPRDSHRFSNDVDKFSPASGTPSQSLLQPVGVNVVLELTRPGSVQASENVPHAEEQDVRSLRKDTRQTAERETSPMDRTSVEQGLSPPQASTDTVQDHKRQAVHSENSERRKQRRASQRTLSSSAGQGSSLTKTPASNVSTATAAHREEHDASDLSPGHNQNKGRKEIRLNLLVKDTQCADTVDDVTPSVPSQQCVADSMPQGEQVSQDSGSGADLDLDLKKRVSVTGDTCLIAKESSQEKTGTQRESGTTDSLLTAKESSQEKTVTHVASSRASNSSSTPTVHNNNNSSERTRDKTNKSPVTGSLAAKNFDTPDFSSFQSSLSGKVVNSAPLPRTTAASMLPLDSDEDEDAVLIVRRTKRKCFSLDGSPLKARAHLSTKRRRIRSRRRELAAESHPATDRQEDVEEEVVSNLASSGAAKSAEGDEGGIENPAEMGDGGNENQVDMDEGGNENQAEMDDGGNENQAEMDDGGNANQADKDEGGNENQPETDEESIHCSFLPVASEQYQPEMEDGGEDQLPRYLTITDEMQPDQTKEPEERSNIAGKEMERKDTVSTVSPMKRKKKTVRGLARCSDTSPGIGPDAATARQGVQQTSRPSGAERLVVSDQSGPGSASKRENLSCSKLTERSQEEKEGRALGSAGYAIRRNSSSMSASEDEYPIEVETVDEEMIIQGQEYPQSTPHKRNNPSSKASEVVKKNSSKDRGLQSHQPEVSDVDANPIAVTRSSASRSQSQLPKLPAQQSLSGSGDDATLPPEFDLNFDEDEDDSDDDDDGNGKDKDIDEGASERVLAEAESDDEEDLEPNNSRGCDVDNKKETSLRSSSQQRRSKRSETSTRTKMTDAGDEGRCEQRQRDPSPRQTPSPAGLRSKKRVLDEDGGRRQQVEDDEEEDGDEEEEDEVLVKRKTRRAVIDSDSDSDHNSGAESEASFQLNFTSSSALSSQSEVPTTQERSRMESELEQMKREVAEMEAKLLGRSTLSKSNSTEDSAQLLSPSKLPGRSTRTKSDNVQNSAQLDSPSKPPGRSKSDNVGDSSRLDSPSKFQGRSTRSKSDNMGNSSHLDSPSQGRSTRSKFVNVEDRALLDSSPVRSKNRTSGGRKTAQASLDSSDDQVKEISGSPSQPSVKKHKSASQSGSQPKRSCRRRRISSDDDDDDEDGEMEEEKRRDREPRQRLMDAYVCDAEDGASGEGSAQGKRPMLSSYRTPDKARGGTSPDVSDEDSNDLFLSPLSPSPPPPAKHSLARKEPHFTHRRSLFSSESPIVGSCAPSKLRSPLDFEVRKQPQGAMAEKAPEIVNNDFDKYDDIQDTQESEAGLCGSLKNIPESPYSPSDERSSARLTGGSARKSTRRESTLKSAEPPGAASDCSSPDSSHERSSARLSAGLARKSTRGKSSLRSAEISGAASDCTSSDSSGSPLPSPLKCRRTSPDRTERNENAEIDSSMDDDCVERNENAESDSNMEEDGGMSTRKVSGADNVRKNGDSGVALRRENAQNTDDNVRIVDDSDALLIKEKNKRSAGRMRMDDDSDVSLIKENAKRSAGRMMVDDDSDVSLVKEKAECSTPAGRVSMDDDSDASLIKEKPKRSARRLRIDDDSDTLLIEKAKCSAGRMRMDEDCEVSLKSGCTDLTPGGVAEEKESASDEGEVDEANLPRWKWRCFGFISSGLNPEKSGVLRKLAESHECKVHSKFNQSVTHVIMKSNDEQTGGRVGERTLKYFQGIAAGCWVLSYQWVLDSVRAGRMLPETQYEMQGDTIKGENHCGPKVSRLSTSLLLEGFAFASVGVNPDMSKKELRQLLSLTGGSMVEDPWALATDPSPHKLVLRCAALPPTPAEIELFNGQYRHFGLVTVAREWILDSICTYKRQSLRDYVYNTCKDLNLPF